jgi:hypothetical protein
METTSDDKQVLSMKVLCIFIRLGWRMCFPTRRYIRSYLNTRPHVLSYRQTSRKSVVEESFSALHGKSYTAHIPDICDGRVNSTIRDSFSYAGFISAKDGYRMDVSEFDNDWVHSSSVCKKLSNKSFSVKRFGARCRACQWVSESRTISKLDAQVIPLE